MKYVYFLFLMLIVTPVNAGIVTSVADDISQILTFNEAESNASLDGHTVIKISTGLSNCPTGVYIQHSNYSSAVLSLTLASYMADIKIAFQVWDDSTKFWKGSGTPYCQVRAVVLQK